MPTRACACAARALRGEEEWFDRLRRPLPARVTTRARGFARRLARARARACLARRDLPRRLEAGAGDAGARPPPAPAGSAEVGARRLASHSLSDLLEYQKL